MENNAAEKKKRTVKARIGIIFKRYFVTGLIIIIPLWLTFFIGMILFNWVTSFTFPILNTFMSDKMWIHILTKIISFFVSVASICVLGFLTNKVLGKTLLNAFEKFIDKVPLIGTVYSAAKQFVGFLFGKDKTKSFKEVVFVPYPNKDFYSTAFKTGEQYIKGEKYACVFMPTTPNPTTGFLLLTKEKDIIYTNYTIDQAFQFIISIGVINMGGGNEVNQHELQQKIEEMKNEL